MKVLIKVLFGIGIIGGLGFVNSKLEDLQHRSMIRRSLQELRQNLDENSSVYRLNKKKYSPGD